MKEATISLSLLFLPVVTILIAAAGLWNAFYFTFAYYGRVKKARWVPEILCAREGSNCVTVVQTPYARVFGVPNSLLGILYYAAVIAWVFMTMILYSQHSDAGVRLMHTFGQYLLAASGFAVLLAFYLIYSLIAKLHTHCPLCYTGHAINAILLLLIALLDSLIRYPPWWRP